MYSDDFFSHLLPETLDKVMYIEGHDLPLDVEEVIEVAREDGATNMQSEGEYFWLVLPDNAKRAWPLTEKALRTLISWWNRNGF